MTSYFQILDTYHNSKKNRLNNYEILIELINKLNDNFIQNEKMNLFAIHTILDSVSHLKDMGYSKAYEFASDIKSQIKQSCFSLVEKIDPKLKEVFKVLINHVYVTDAITQKENLSSWIKYYSPWDFYLIQNSESMELFIWNHLNEYNEIKSVPDAYQQNMIKQNKYVYEILYGQSLSKKREYWLNKKAVN